MVVARSLAEDDDASRTPLLVHFVPYSFSLQRLVSSMLMI